MTSARHAELFPDLGDDTRMRHIVALIVKYLFLLAINAVVLTSVTDATFGQAAVVALVMTVLLYLLGDLFVLPTMGNMSAVIADSGLALVIAWLAPVYTMISGVTFGQALVIGLLVGVAEYFFHSYLRQAVFTGRS